MDAEKRKLKNDHGDETSAGKKQKISKPEERQNDVEEEVEEFFAILRRIQSAAKYFQKVDGSGRRLTAKMNTWKPSFHAEDFEEADCAKDGEVDDSRERERTVEDNSGLDLNSEPAGTFEKGEEHNVF